MTIIWVDSDACGEDTHASKAA